MADGFEPFGGFFKDLFTGNIGHGQLIGDAAKALTNIGPGGLIKDVLAGGGLIASLLKGNRPVQGQQQLQQSADQANQQSKTLETYLLSGTLPPGLQAGLDQAYNDAAATIRSRYAQTGMSGSSAEETDLQNLRTRLQSQAAQQALSLFQSGLNEAQISERLYYDLMQAQIQQDSAFQGAIGNFVGGLSGMGQPAVPGGQPTA